MVTLLSNSSSIHIPKLPLLFNTHISTSLRYERPFKLRNRRRNRGFFSINAIEKKNSFESKEKQPRTLFPGGFKRPEIKVPTLVLQLSSDEVFKKEGVLDSIEIAVSKWVSIVVLNGSEESGGRFYEAARLLKSVIKDRAYLLIDERVDIAAAIGASGVVLSDQGLPAIVARNMMMESKSESVFLPLVARIVHTPNAAFSASTSEGADFLIYGDDRGSGADILGNSVIQNVKIPVFTMISLLREDSLYVDASKLLQSGASGLVISLDDMKLFSDEALSKLFAIANIMNERTQDQYQSYSKLENMDTDKEFHGRKGITGFIKLEEREKQFIELERIVLLETIAVIRKAAPLMEEVSLLIDAVSQLDEPFLLVIVGEFNSGKSTVINALLGRRYLKEGVVPTTNEITLLRYTEMDTYEQERCERHPDGQYICYLPAPILQEMNLVDTPGTNVILQRQQRLTEEFVPRSDLLLFVISADRPLTASEVTFLNYIQQWKKKVVFVLNKSDLYQNDSELEEAIAFIKENVRKLLNTEHVTLYPVSARSAIEAKLSVSLDFNKFHSELLENDSRWISSGYYEFEKFLLSFLDGSTKTGKERIKLKLGTPIGIADRLIAACETLVRKDYESAVKDLAVINEIVSGVKEYAKRMESESLSWRKQTLSMVDTARTRTVRLIESTLKLSNLDLVVSYVFKFEKPYLRPASSSVQNDIIGPALSDTERLLGEYLIWLQSNNAREGKNYEDFFKKRWPSIVNQYHEVHSENYKLQRREEVLCVKVIEDFSASAAAKLFEQEIREVVLGTFLGLGAAGLSASLLTSVLPTTLEDLLALGLCSAGGLLVISKFPARRKEIVEKVQRTADSVARQLEEAMQKDLLYRTEDLENYVKLISKPYQDEAQQRVNRLLEMQEDLTGVGKKLQNLQTGIQNLHVS